MKIFGHRLHLGKRVKKVLGIRNNWSRRIFGKTSQSKPVSSAAQLVTADRRLASIA